jgi:hypothetical protein
MIGINSFPYSLNSDTVLAPSLTIPFILKRIMPDNVKTPAIPTICFVPLCALDVNDSTRDTAIKLRQIPAACLISGETAVTASSIIKSRLSAKLSVSEGISLYASLGGVGMSNGDAWTHNDVEDIKIRIRISFLITVSASLLLWKVPAPLMEYLTTI